ncbi:ubiquinol-cytochrome c reductase iron-sulfur subunit [Candidatus Electronema sp. PJ]|uniref:QcrA and Rieske domain-containing protein n=1 Tax=Candidatus Electronema sp. PJ TaxID=3401572 RepID=UPI003AA8FB4A
MNCPASQQQPDRRRFVTGLIRWAAALSGMALIHPLLKFTGYTIKPKPRHVKITAPLPRSGVHAEREFFLFAETDRSKAWAISRTCTHLGCRVNFLEDKQLIECPCHQSRFTPQGKRLAGPAKKNLAVFPVEVQKDASGVVIGYVVTL